MMPNNEPYTYLNNTLKDSAQEVDRLKNLYTSQLQLNSAPIQLEVNFQDQIFAPTNIVNPIFSGKNLLDIKVQTKEKKRGRPSKTIEDKQPKKPMKPKIDEGKTNTILKDPKKVKKLLVELTDTQRKEVYFLKGKISKEATALQFGVSEVTISRIWSGKVTTKKRGGAVTRKLGETESNLLHNELLKDNQIKGKELQEKIKTQLKKDISISAINLHMRSAIMTEFGNSVFTIKRVRYINEQRNAQSVKLQRKEFIKNILNLVSLGNNLFLLTRYH